MIVKNLPILIDFSDETKQIVVWPPNPDFSQLKKGGKDVATTDSLTHSHDFSGVFVATDVDVQYERNGNTVTCTVKANVINTLSVSANLISDAIPQGFVPTTAAVCSVNVKNAGVFQTGVVKFVTDHWEFSLASLGPFTALSCGIEIGTSWTYLLN